MMANREIPAGLRLGRLAGMIAMSLVLVGPGLVYGQEIASARPTRLPRVWRASAQTTSRANASPAPYRAWLQQLGAEAVAKRDSARIGFDTRYEKLETLSPRQGLLGEWMAQPEEFVVDGPPHSEFAQARCGVQCDVPGQCRGKEGWKSMELIPWEIFAQGEYIGPARTAHVPEYRIRVDDTLDFVYRLTQQASQRPYELNVGDRLRIESMTSALLDRDVLVQPDGTITLRLLGQVPVAGQTVAAVRKGLEQSYKRYVKLPSITVTPLELNSRLEELRATVDNRAGVGGQSRETRVTPAGTVQLPAIGTVMAQGLTLNELGREVESHYRELVEGLGVTPILLVRAPRYVYVVGEVAVPGRFALEGPTTVMQSIALAGGWNVGGNLNHVVVFRRDQNWNLMATKLDIFGALYGHEPCPADEIWIRDSDIVVVPKRNIKVFNDLVELVFTRGVHSILPTSASLDFLRLSTL